MVKLSSLKLNEGNPRFIRDERFEKAVDSVLQFPEMMEKRGLVTDKKMGMLGGNMRLRALRKIILEMPDNELIRRCQDKPGLIEFWQKIRKEKAIPDNWIQDASGWTEEQKKRFVIADNVGFGQWDFDLLANEWEAGELEAWGMELPDEWNDDERINNLNDGEEIEFGKSVQLEPPKEYILIMAEPNSVEWEEMKEMLKLKMVRRGGYKKGSDFDSVSLERVIWWSDFKSRIDVNSSTE